MKHNLFKAAYPRTGGCLENKYTLEGPIAAEGSSRLLCGHMLNITDLSTAVRYLRLQEYAMEQARLGNLTHSKAIEDMNDLFKAAFPKGI